MKKKLIIILVVGLVVFGIVNTIVSQPSLLKPPTKAGLVRDPQLEQAIRDVIGKPDGTLYLADVITLRELSLSGKMIEDLTGLGNIQNLEKLDLSNNYISLFSSLSTLKYLTEINLANNRISDLERIMPSRWPKSGTLLILENNPLNDASINTYIPQLIARGVDVRW